MLSNFPSTFETERLIANRLAYQDEAALYETVNFKSVVEPIAFFSWPLSTKAFSKWFSTLLTAQRNEKELGYLILSKAMKTPVGFLGLHTRRLNTVEIGYWLVPMVQHKGLGSELVRSVLLLAKERAICSKLIATTSQNNEASAKLLLKQGFQQTKECHIPTTTGDERPSFYFEYPINLQAHHVSE